MSNQAGSAKLEDEDIIEAKDVVDWRRDQGDYLYGYDSHDRQHGIFTGWVRHDNIAHHIRSGETVELTSPS